MEFILKGYDGRRWRLPQPLSWRMAYTSGTPCDCFELTCPWEGGIDSALGEAVRFQAGQAGETVFSGVVDEWSCAWDQAGGTLSVTGRGMAALLLDNEAQGQEYQVATTADILRDHVQPYGIQVARTAKLPAVAGFSIAAGSSEWQALYDFARYHGGVEPRFDRLGRLVLAPWEDQTIRLLDGRTVVAGIRYRDRRYGVLSQVLVRDRGTPAVQLVENREFLRQGGQCRRVLTMPGRSSYQAMRYSGQYQIERSAQERRRLSLTVPQLFFAWPGERFQLQLERPKLGGVWRVLESETGWGEKGAYTLLELGEA